MNLLRGGASSRPNLHDIQGVGKGAGLGGCPDLGAPRKQQALCPRVRKAFGHEALQAAHATAASASAAHASAAPATAAHASAALGYAALGYAEGTHGHHELGVRGVTEEANEVRGAESHRGVGRQGVGARPQLVDGGLHRREQVWPRVPLPLPP